MYTVTAGINAIKLHTSLGSFNTEHLNRLLQYPQAQMQVTVICVYIYVV